MLEIGKLYKLNKENCQNFAIYTLGIKNCVTENFIWLDVVRCKENFLLVDKQKDYLIFFVLGQKYFIEENESWLFKEIEIKDNV